MKKILLISIILLLLTACSSNSNPIPSYFPEMSIEPESITGNNMLESAPVSSNQDFELTEFMEKVVFDTQNEPKMYIQNGDTSFYVNINTALPIKDTLDIQSWEPVSKESIPDGSTDFSITLYNGNKTSSSITIDTQRNYVFVTVYEYDAKEGVTNVSQYPYIIETSIVKAVQKLIEEIQAVGIQIP